MIFALMRELASRPNRDETPFHTLFQTAIKGVEIPLSQEQHHQIILQTPNSQMRIDAIAVFRLWEALFALLGFFLGALRFQLPLDQPPDVIGSDRRMHILLH